MPLEQLWPEEQLLHQRNCDLSAAIPVLFDSFVSRWWWSKVLPQITALICCSFLGKFLCYMYEGHERTSHVKA